jgi:hypothetical protein
MHVFLCISDEDVQNFSLLNKIDFLFSFLGGLECVGHFFAYVAHFLYF